MSHRSPLLLLVFACAVVSGTAMAQSQSATPTAPPAANRPMHVPDPQRQLERLNRKLGLTPDQQARLGPLLQQRDQQLQAVRNDTSLAPSDRRTKAAAILRDSEQQLDAVLTDTQRRQWQDLRQQARQQRHAHAPASTSGDNGE